MAELLVGMVVSGIVLSVLFAGLMGMQRTDRYTAADSEALAELRVSVDRLTSELREARRVYADSNARAAHFWVDADRDNNQDLSERITWRLTTVAGEGRLVRETDVAGTADDVLVSTEVVVADAFTYAPAAPNTTEVDIRLQADAEVGGSGGARVVETDIRLRNANFG